MSAETDNTDGIDEPKAVGDSADEARPGGDPVENGLRILSWIKGSSPNSTIEGTHYCLVLPVKLPIGGAIVAAAGMNFAAVPAIGDCLDIQPSLAGWRQNRIVDRMIGPTWITLLLETESTAGSDLADSLRTLDEFAQFGFYPFWLSAELRSPMGVSQADMRTIEQILAPSIFRSPMADLGVQFVKRYEGQERSMTSRRRPKPSR